MAGAPRAAQPSGQHTTMPAPRAVCRQKLSHNVRRPRSSPVESLKARHVDCPAPRRRRRACLVGLRAVSPSCQSSNHACPSPSSEALPTRIGPCSTSPPRNTFRCVAHPRSIDSSGLFGCSLQTPLRDIIFGPASTHKRCKPSIRMPSSPMQGAQLVGLAEACKLDVGCSAGLPPEILHRTSQVGALAAFERSSSCPPVPSSTLFGQ